VKDNPVEIRSGPKLGAALFDPAANLVFIYINLVLFKHFFQEAKTFTDRSEGSI
jgi:hypothetical protein